jgi:hypothetical protein
MRFILVIPVLVLFLSNVPFIQEMPMEAMMAMMDEQEQEECHKSSSRGEEVETSCSMSTADKKPAKPMACNAADMPDEGACQPSGANCICICVFQFAAPTQDIKAFHIFSIDKLAGYTGYLQLKWKDPHIASPGQPPDWA